MSELQNNYWYCKVYLHYVETVDKVKMDYSFFQLIDDKKDNHTLKSINSPERFDCNTYKLHKFGFVNKVKLVDGIYFSFIFKNQISSFTEAGKTILPIVKKYITPRLFFKPRFKEFFSRRIEQILLEYE